MKTKLLILTLLVFITIVLLFTPYKFYTLSWPIITPNCSSNIAEELSQLFEGDWLSIPFVFIFLPLALLLEIFFFEKPVPKKMEDYFYPSRNSWNTRNICHVLADDFLSF
ncbi:MAG: hypothetical protein WC476_00280 [Phycisphaerae bacterium]